MVFWGKFWTHGEIILSITLCKKSWVYIYDVTAAEHKIGILKKDEQRMVDRQVVKRILEIRGKELMKEIFDIIHSLEFDVNTKKIGFVYKTLMQ